MFLILWAIAMAGCGLLVSRRLSKCKKPVAIALRSSLGGLALLMLLNVLQTIIGFSLPLNYVTVSAAVILGPPGAILLLILNLFV